MVEVDDESVQNVSNWGQEHIATPVTLPRDRYVNKRHWTSGTTTRINARMKWSETEKLTWRDLNGD